MACQASFMQMITGIALLVVGGIALFGRIIFSNSKTLTNYLFSGIFFRITVAICRRICYNKEENS